jgi:hypothetical protein
VALAPSLWIDHLEPRLARVDGITVRKQLVGGHGLDHELGTVLIWRWAQMDRELNMDCPYITYNHVLEPDFSVSSFFMLSTHPHPASGVFIFYGEGEIILFLSINCYLQTLALAEENIIRVSHIQKQFVYIAKFIYHQRYDPINFLYHDLDPCRVFLIHHGSHLL